MKPFHVYMLVCADQSYYVGHTDDLEQRLADHEHGTFGGYTSERRPIRLVWSQEMTTRDEAIVAERRIKGWTRAKKEALIRGDWAAINRLARGKDWTERPGAVRPSTTARTDRVREVLERAYAQDERTFGETHGEDERNEAEARDPQESVRPSTTARTDRVQAILERAYAQDERTFGETHGEDERTFGETHGEDERTFGETHGEDERTFGETHGEDERTFGETHGQDERNEVVNRVPQVSVRPERSARNGPHETTGRARSRRTNERT